jgi:Leucine-rich repeat (LRR) protein
LSENQIVDIDALTGLTSLGSLSVWSNQISDIDALRANPGLAAGDTLQLQTNPLNDQSIDEDVPALCDRGVDVYWTDSINRSCGG